MLMLRLVFLNLGHRFPTEDRWTIDQNINMNYADNRVERLILLGPIGENLTKRMIDRSLCFVLRKKLSSKKIDFSSACSGGEIMCLQYNRKAKQNVM
jgi:hypothetical protein